MEPSRQEIIQWLLDGDVAVQYQVYQDLKGEERQDLRARIETEGWGRKFLSFQKASGHWGQKYYQPKWISTHYTLLDLKHLMIRPDIDRIRDTVAMLLAQEKGPDGGINPSPNIEESDVCLNGMFLEFACYFGADEEQLKSIIDFILQQQMPGGGYNCFYNRPGARHGSLHSTLSVLEGILEYKLNGYRYRLQELEKAEVPAREFILKHRLYLSDRTGEIIHKNFLRLTYPYRWYYNILRALDYFRRAGCSYDKRMKPAIDVLLGKQKKDGTWHLQAKHPGRVHFEMEKTGKPSRWNTLRALRVLDHYPWTRDRLPV